MGLRALAASAAAFLVLAAVAWWILEREPPSVEGPFFTLARRLPDTLTVIQNLDTTVVVPEGPGGWTVIRPLRYPADVIVLQAMIGQLAKIEVDRRFPLDVEKLDSYGIRIPRGRIRAAYRDGTPPDTLTIGAFTFDDAYDYVQNGSRPEVGLLPARISRAYLLKSTVELRETRLLPFLASRAVRLRLLGPTGEARVELVRDPVRGWEVLSPYPGPASGEKVGEYLESLGHMHVRSFLREGEGPDAPYGLDRPAAQARVTLEGGEELGLLLGRPIPGTDLIYAKTLARPHVFGVSDKYPPVLARGADPFRRRAVVALGLTEVSEVAIARGGDGASRTIRPDSTTRELRDALGNWVLLEADSFSRATPAAIRDLDLSPLARGLLWTAGADTLARVDLGRPRGDATPLRVSAGREARPSEVLWVPSDRVEPLYRFLADSSSAP